MSINFLEFTCFSEKDPGGYTEKPTFYDHIWPYILSHIGEFECVYLFLNHYLSDHFEKEKWKTKISENIYNIGPLSNFSEKALEEIGMRSYDAGHLGVLYQIPASSNTLLDLIDLWPYEGQLIANSDDLGLKDSEIIELKKFTESIDKESFLMAFGHDADPMYLFGNNDMLLKLSITAKDKFNKPKA